MNKIYALCDANSFYASVEQLFNPAWRNKPVVVASNNDGCVVARSAEAKALGIKMGAPLFEVKPLVKSHGLVVRSSNYALYGDLSARFMAALEEISPQVIPYSIDEAFLDLTGVGASVDLYEFGEQAKLTVKKWVGLPICVGISSSLTLAKLANNAAKKYRKTNGVVDLTDVDRQKRLLALTPVEDLWGIGSRLAKRLRSLGISTGLELRNSDPAWIRQHFSVVVERTVWDLRGVPSHELDEAPVAKQQILCSRSFGKPVSSLEDMRSAIVEFAARAAEKLRGEDRVAGRVQAFLSTNRFKDGPAYSNTATMPLAYPSSDSRVIVEAALRSTEAIWREGFKFTKAGVMLNDFDLPELQQDDFFSKQRDDQQSQALMVVMDKINQLQGRRSVQFGRQAIKEKPWAMKREFLSPSYTTRWSDLPVVHG